MPPPTLQAALADRLSPDRAHDVLTALGDAGATGHVSALWEELRACSANVAGRAVDALPDVVARCGAGMVAAWLDLAIALAGRSGAMSLQYLNESPRWLGVLASSELRRNVVGTALELADGESACAANCALAFFRTAPELLAVDPRADLSGWAEIGRELTEWNQVLGIEFLRTCPNVAEVLALDEARPWVAFGMKLITRNSLGKPDYMGALEFFRTSPGLIGAIPDAALRPLVVSAGSCLADHAPDVALTFLAESPALVNGLPSTDRRRVVLEYGRLLAERDASAAMEYFRRAPDVVRLGDGAEGGNEAFDAWFRGGMAALEYSAEGARAYFALETSSALRSIEQATQGVPLRDAARSLQWFAHMICGMPVRIASLSDAASPARLEMGQDGPVLLLPAMMNRYAVKARNVRRYTVMVAHEVAHVAFGTYRLDMPFLRDLAQRVARRYAREANGPVVNGLADVFALYPQPGVMRDLWAILEDARVECLLQGEYPGLRRDLAEETLASVRTRSLLHGMTAREMALDHLLLRFAESPDAGRVPPALQPVVDRCWARARTILHPHATHEQSVASADSIYQTLDAMIGGPHDDVPGRAEDDRRDEDEGPGAGPRAAEAVTGEYRAVAQWAYRGAMNPDAVRGAQDAADDPGEASDDAGAPAPDWADTGEPGSRVGSRSDERRAADTGSVSGEHEAGDEAGAVLDAARSAPGAGRGPWAVSSGTSPLPVYPEWDGGLQDYRLAWCRVIERPGEEGSQDFSRGVLERHAPALRLLRRYFETLRPSALRRVHGCEDGDDVDVDAALRRVAEQRAGADPSDRIYSRREKRERRVAAAFVVDMSGSTSRQLAEGRRVIDVEKEGLVLLAEAMDAIGDDYALYGFSGRGRHQVEVMALKDFGDARRPRTGRRIEAMTPLRQNRDGAAIRHVTRQLLRCPARHRLLLLLSDGRPLDDDYGDEYALQDTRMALREARRQGVRPFCLTIDQEASGYLQRMYGDTHYCVLDDARRLPERLPRLYHRLTGRA